MRTVDTISEGFIFRCWKKRFEIHHCTLYIFAYGSLGDTTSPIIVGWSGGASSGPVSRVKS
ncbi:Bgt-20848 [Blumeria graminis f. sp. tritici]|uniref:Bgt-20848 n=2 Tax=Blumeria graminis f. sp. tritici TaxID=62690 RepID=A0A9X9L8B1_BLUGR|nr:Bgt-20848 [Blumeria graminis f. sp. tritici]